MAGNNIFLFSMAQPPNRLRYWREARGLSQQALADAAECSKMQISRFERSLQGMDLAWVHLFASILSVSPADLLADGAAPDSARDADERRLLDLYRAAPPEARDQLMRVSVALVAPDGSVPLSKNAA